MSGVVLPHIPGALPSYTRSLPAGFDSRSRPLSSSSNASGYTVVPHVYYGSHDICSFRGPTRSSGRSYSKLPSLRHKGGPSSLNSEISSQYSAKYRSTSDLSQTKVASSPFLPKSDSEECLKCLLKVPHKRCESHKYIRVGGGYRHGYWYVKTLLEELELQRQRELIRQQRLQAIKEKEVKAIKTYIRTKSGRLIEKIIFLSEEDYEAFKAGKNVADILSKYLSKDEAAGLESWDKDEVKAIKTYVRTKSGRLIEKVVYVSKSDYDAITSGQADAKDLLKKYAGEGEVIEGWDEAKMKTIKTYVRTKSGRLIEKTIMISQEDYDAMIRDGKNPNDILKKYLSLDDGEQFESWTSAEPMKAIKTMVRTKSGRLIEKTVYVSAEDYDKLVAGGGDMNEILGKYMNDDDGKIEGWEKAPSNPMKVVKTYIRTKSGRLIEKQILLTEEEFRKFQESGGDPNFLKQFIKLEAGEVIDSWEKASTVYSAGSDVRNAKEGQRIVGKDGEIYEVVVDPITGKKYKKRVGGKESDIDSGFASMQKGKKGKGGKEETAEERKKRKQGGRDAGSDSDYSYRSVVSAGGTRHVRRRRKHADGTYSDSESYHSDADPEGAARRRRRRREREHQNSAHSYYSVTSEGGTRTVRRKKKNADGTYGDSESYHSEDSHKEGGGLAERKKKQKEKTEREEAEKRRKARKERHGSGSDHSYFSETSEGGTRTLKRKKKIRDEHGNVIGYGDVESYHSDNERYKEQKAEEKKKEQIKKEKEAKKKAKEEFKKNKLQELREKGLISPSSDWTIDSDTGEPLRKAQKAEVKEKKKQKKLQELRDKGLISPSSDWTLDSDGEPARRSELVKQGKRPAGEDGKGGKGGKGGKKNKDGNEADDESEEAAKQKKAKINKKGKNGGDGKAQNGGVGKGKKGSKGKGKLTKEEKQRLKEEKQRLKAGKRNDDSDSDFSYRSVVSAGGTRHVRRRRKRADGTYSDSDSYHSSQDEDGEERRRQRRKERGELESDTVDSSNPNTSNGSKDHYHDGDSDYSYASEVSEGGTRYEVKRKRLRDEEGNIIGYGEKEAAGDNLSDTESVKTRRGSMDGSFVKDRINVEDVLGPQLNEHNENNRLKDGVDWPGKPLARIPSEFSDASTDDDDVDLSKMTEEEKEEYFKNKEERRKEREARRRAKYGDKYDEIMKKKQEKKEREKKEQEQEQSNEEKEKRDQKEKDEKTSGRKSSLRKFSDSLGKGKEPAKSMVTYEKGPPREIGGKETFDSREHGLPHDSWGKKDKTDMSLRRGSSDTSDFVPTKLRRETTMLKKLPTIPQGKVAEVTKKKKPGMEDRESSQYEGDDDDDSLKRRNRGDEEKSKWDSVVEMGADGKLRLKKKLIDLKDLDDETLRRLGIDPTLTAKEIAKKLKALFGNDIRFKEGSFFIGTKHADDFGDMDDDELAKQDDLDITTLNGQRRINILMKRGGSALRRHMLRIIAECRLHENAYKCANIDEQGSIDFLAHYRLVDPKKVDGYAKAFVVEDTDFDTFIDYKNTKSALDGIESIQHMTPKQMEYVFRVLNIDEATRVTFRMFAVLTALCERVSTMDDLSRQLLEICNLLDIERKLDLYKAMFYTNVPTYRDSNYVTEESLKIELMAGGLNWSQQEYVMEKMEPNTFGEISFLDYMCYIPLFLSMHDNICDNPLDMSNQKYQMPPRRRPPSVQRDMNPLSQPLSKQSAFLLRKQAVDFEEGTANPDHYTKEYVQRVNKYAQLPDIPHILQRQSSNVSTTSEYLSGSSFYREKSRVY